VDNLTQIAVTGGNTANRNTWDGNHWSDYEGFDQDGDGVGDTPYIKGSPMLEVLDYLERLAPLSEPRMLVQDAHPRLSPEPVIASQAEEAETGFDALEQLRKSLGR